MSIQPVSIAKSVNPVEQPSNGASRADAIRKPMLPAAALALVEHLVESLPFPREHSKFALVALRDLACEFISGKPDLAKETAPGASLGMIIKSDPVFAAAALQLFRDLKLDSHRAVAAYEQLRPSVSSAIVESASADVRELMNSFAPPLNRPLLPIIASSRL